MARILTITPNPALDLTVQLGEVHLGRVNRAGAAQLEPAGKGINVGRLLARLGHSVTVTGFLGAGNEQAFVRALRHWTLRDAFLRAPGETRINIKLAEASGRVTDLNGPGVELDEGAASRLLTQVRSLLAETDLVVIAGSLPPGFSCEALAELIAVIRGKGLPVWLDTSGAALVAGVKAGPTGIKPNEEELQMLTLAPLGTAEERVRAVRALHGSGIADIVLSAGPAGVTWSAAGTVLSATPPTVPVVSTVGAGDALLGGIIHGKLSGWSQAEALRFATALSAEAVRHVGSGDPAAADFPALKQQTLIHPADARGESGETDS